MLKKLFVITFVLLITCILSVNAVTTLPISITDTKAISITEPIVSSINTTASNGEVILNNETASVTLIATTVSTPTQIPTLGSMVNARTLGNGNPYPNYKVNPVVVDTGDGMGALYLNLKCHHNLISKEFTLQKVSNSKNIEFTNGNIVNKEFTELFNNVGNETVYAIKPDGTWDERITPSTYVIKLRDGNGGQPEWAVVRVFEGQTVNVNLLGHAVSTGNEPTIIEDNECPKIIPESFWDWFITPIYNNDPKPCEHYYHIS